MLYLYSGIHSENITTLKRIYQINSGSFSLVIHIRRQIFFESPTPDLPTSPPTRAISVFPVIPQPQQNLDLPCLCLPTLRRRYRGQGVVPSPSHQRPSATRWRSVMRGSSSRHTSRRTGIPLLLIHWRRCKSLIHHPPDLIHVLPPSSPTTIGDDWFPAGFLWRSSVPAEVLRAVGFALLKRADRQDSGEGHGCLVLLVMCSLWFFY